ncbi:carbohydrate ABC transporter permease [Reinekea marina]|uniref:sn-glycerol-3-phosphate transport system permease protein UgpE n=1 Tax=Reinekea marina TaxID=1310421 RepID=A0ABV7WSP2_9GAMM|nr:carbohydrate ABC transporter permease [Reinekea marina]MDN3649022.1 carbohydrate ABC transporter permease [Reinekea marina]
MFPTPIAETRKFTQVSYKVALPIAIILWLLPLAAVLMTSVRSIADINAGNYWGIPESFNLIENYSAVFGSTNMARYLLNSILVTVPVMFGSVLLATLAGFGLAKFKFKGRLAVFALFIGGNFVPFQILMIPVRDLTISLGMYDTVWALILFHLAFQTGFCTMFMRNFIVGIPDELLESCRLEGASEWKIFNSIILPLVRPALAALAVLIFTFVWNDYFWALVLVQSDEVRPVTAGISALRGQWLASWNLISAGSIVAALPPVILFFAMQKHFIAGLTLGATKG